MTHFIYVTYYIKWVTTSWTYSFKKNNQIIGRLKLITKMLYCPGIHDMIKLLIGKKWSFLFYNIRLNSRLNLAKTGLFHSKRIIAEIFSLRAHRKLRMPRLLKLLFLNINQNVVFSHVKTTFRTKFLL